MIISPWSRKCCAAFARFLDDGRICRSNAAAERAVRGIVIGQGKARLPEGTGRHGVVAVSTPHRDVRIKRRRSTGPARQRSRKAAGSSREAARRLAAMDLEAAAAGNRRSGLSHSGVDYPKIAAAPAGRIRLIRVLRTG
jgi:hypothetical protein